MNYYWGDIIVFTYIGWDKNNIFSKISSFCPLGIYAYVSGGKNETQNSFGVECINCKLLNKCNVDMDVLLLLNLSCVYSFGE